VWLYPDIEVTDVVPFSPRTRSAFSPDRPLYIEQIDDDAARPLLIKAEVRMFLLHHASQDIAIERNAGWNIRIAQHQMIQRLRAN